VTARELEIMARRASLALARRDAARMEMWDEAVARAFCALRLRNALGDYDEGQHPRGPDGRWIKKEGEGRTAETFAYKKEGKAYRLKKDGSHEYEPDPIEEKFTFSKMGKERKEKETPHLDQYRDVPDTGARTFKGMGEGDIYRRGAAIDYGTHEETTKKGAVKVVSNRKEGQPQYEWTLGGKPVPREEAGRLESAFKEAGCVVFDPTAQSAMVRRDFANGRGQLFSYTAADGRVQTRYDRQTERENQAGKFRSVNSIVANYDRLFDHIAHDAEAGSMEANTAYFLTRTKCRIGGSGKNDNLGALDLTSRNVSVSGDTVRVEFDAKNAHWRQTVQDPRLARFLEARIAATPPGKPILGSATSPTKVNGYLTGIGEREGVVRDLKGKGFTAHNIRHAGATRLASELVDQIKIDPKKDRQGYLNALAGVVVRCGRHICDSPSVALEKYISDSVLFKNAPELLEEYRRAYANEGADDAAAGAAQGLFEPIVADDGDGVVTEITPTSAAYFTEGAFGDGDDEGEDGADAPFILDEDYEAMPALAELRDLVVARMLDNQQKGLLNETYQRVEAGD